MKKNLAKEMLGNPVRLDGIEPGIGNEVEGGRGEEQESVVVVMVVVYSE